MTTLLLILLAIALPVIRVALLLAGRLLGLAIGLLICAAMLVFVVIRPSRRRDAKSDRHQQR